MKCSLIFLLIVIIGWIWLGFMHILMMITCENSGVLVMSCSSILGMLMYLKIIGCFGVAVLMVLVVC